MKMDNLYLKDQVAVITGASKGLGKAISLSLADRGASVVLSDIDRDEGEKASSEIIEKGGQARFIECDVKKESDIHDMAREVMATFKRIDILVNNAGIGTIAPTWELPTEAWDDIMSVNLRGAFLCSKTFIPHMIDQKSGKVINIASGVGRQAQPLMSAYAASKAGMISLTVCLAKETADFGINVNAVCPGPVETAWWDKPRKILSKILDVSESEVVNTFTQTKQSIKVPLRPEDTARVVCWLCCADAALMTGQAISIDGGEIFPTY
jgi:NAD(P)-dependent dehydrogenase (short-subunit alcohol dehydrogenase family)